MDPAGRDLDSGFGACNRWRPGLYRRSGGEFLRGRREDGNAAVEFPHRRRPSWLRCDLFRRWPPICCHSHRLGLAGGRRSQQHLAAYPHAATRFGVNRFCAAGEAPVMQRLAFLACMAFSAVLPGAQSPQVTRGADLFRVTCAVVYCHGAEGAAARAPRLAGRNFQAGELFDLIVDGKAGTGMPGFGAQLSTDEIEAVTQYVLSLSGTSAGASAPVGPITSKIPAAAEKGRGLFFDAVRMGGCGKCHELEDRGSAVGPDLHASAPELFQNLRTASHSRVV